MYTVRVAIYRKLCKIERLLQQTTNRKWYLAYGIAPFPIIRSDHSLLQAFSNANFCSICSSWQFQLTQRVARSLCDSWASYWVIIISTTHYRTTNDYQNVSQFKEGNRWHHTSTPVLPPGESLYVYALFATRHTAYYGPNWRHHKAGST